MMPIQIFGFGEVIAVQGFVDFFVGVARYVAEGLSGAIDLIG